MSSDSWKEVSGDAPCPICGKPDWCRISPDGTSVACRRERGVASKPVQYRDGAQAFVHRLNGSHSVGTRKKPKPPGTVRPPVEVADTATRDRVYRQFLNLLDLSPDHRAGLRKRGLSDDRIDAGGYRTWDRSVLVTLRLWHDLADVFKTIPGFGPECRIHAPAGLLIPCRTVSGQIIALKIRRDAIRGKQKRYSYLSSNWDGHDGPGPGAPCHVPADTSSPAEWIRITEGELKADVASALSGVPTISFPGAQSWRKAYDTAMAMGATTIVVAFDADASTNKAVSESLQQCVKAVISDGLAVELELWDPSDGKGIDDLLSAGKRQRIIAGHQAAVEAGRIFELAAAGPIKPNEADDDPHRLARVNLEQYASRRGGRTLRYWRDEWYVWRETNYRRITEKELRAKITQSCKQEFDRIHLRRQVEEKDEEGETTKRVTCSLVTNVLQATAGITVLSSSVEPMTWLSTRDKKSYVAMRNGILDMEAVIADRDNYLLPHSPDWFSTICLPYAFSPDATCPKWEAFLEHNLEMDPERIKLLQEWAGYLLLPDTGQQKFLVLEGEGANGKSVFCAAIEAMLGSQNVSHVPLEVFGEKFELTTTLDRLANICGDAGELDKVAEGHIKAFTAGNPMTFGRKYLDSVERVPTARLMMAVNNRPRFSDRSDGVWRRMLLVPWRIQVTAEDRIANMDKPWWWERSGELPGILLWAIHGLYRLQTQGRFTDSEVCEEALSDYRSEMNPARTFLKEHLEESQTSRIRSSVLYELYVKWSKSVGHYPLSDRQFGREVFRSFRKCKRIKCGTRDRFWVYDGICFSCDEICGEKTDSSLIF